MMEKPLMVELFAGLHGWGEAAVAEGFRVIGFDIVDMCAELGHARPEGVELVLRDVLTIHGSEFRDAAVIVASPPCQAYSYRAMPWSRAKALPPPNNDLFNACFRIQREASEAAGRYIPMVVENVRGAQKWVGRAAWHHGSFYLWGDVPALMPITMTAQKSARNSCKRLPGANGGKISGWPHKEDAGTKNEGGSWFAIGGPGQTVTGQNPDGRKTHGQANIRNGHTHTRHLTNQSEHDAVKQPGIGGMRENGKGDAWFQDGAASHGSRSRSRKEASAMIAKIPFSLAQHIARTYYPKDAVALSEETRGLHDAV